MKKAVLIPLIIGGALLTTATAIVAIGLINSANDKIITKTHEVSSYDDIKIDISTADLEFVMSNDSKDKVVVEEKEKQYHIVKVENNTLTIDYVNDSKWYENWFNFKKMKVTVYTSKSAYNNVNIKSSTGDINISNAHSFNDLNVKLSTGNIDVKASVKNAVNIESSTGDISLKGMSPKNMNVKASTGHVTLNKVEVENHLEIKTSTGDVTLARVDAKTIDISASTGDVNAHLLSGKTFDISTSTGKTSYPASLVGAGLCKIRTSTGDITVTIE